MNHCTQLRLQESAPWQSHGMRVARCAHPRGRSFYSARRNRPRSRRRSAGGCGRPEQAHGRSPVTSTRGRGRRACLCRISRHPPPPRPALMHCFLGTTANSVTVGYTLCVYKRLFSHSVLSSTSSPLARCRSCTSWTCSLTCIHANWSSKRDVHWRSNFHDPYDAALDSLHPLPLPCSTSWHSLIQHFSGNR